MSLITNIKIDGFRRLHSFEVEMRPLMVLVGANGVGKTSFLDGLSLFSASASGKLNRNLSDMGGIESLLTRGRAKELSFAARMEVEGRNPIQYDLTLESRGVGYSIAGENLVQKNEQFSEPFKHICSHPGDIKYYEVEGRNLVKPDWDYDTLETSLSQVPRMFRQPEELRTILATANRYHVLDVGGRSPVKLPQSMRPALHPGENGEDLVPFLYYLRESDSDRFESVVDSMRAAFPGLEGFSFPPVAAGMLTMTWKDRDFTKPIYMNELSEGTLRFLWLVALLHSPKLSYITMIDEPETSLHPELLGLLSELMREASKKTQLVVATHSDRFVRFMKPEEVLVMDLDEDGLAVPAWGDSLELGDWLEDYSLDELWRMGRIGGRP